MMIESDELHHFSRGRSTTNQMVCLPPKPSTVAIENGTFTSLIYLLKMVIFHSYVSLPEGNVHTGFPEMGAPQHRWFTMKFLDLYLGF